MLQSAWGYWRRLESPVSLPAPVLLPGTTTEAPAALTPVGGREIETCVVPVPVRYRSALALALADAARRRGDDSEMAKYLAAVDATCASVDAADRQNPRLDIGLELCLLISHAMHCACYNTSKSRRATQAVLDRTLSKIDRLFGRNGDKDCKFWEWTAVSAASAVVSGETRAVREAAFERVRYAVDQMLTLRQSDAPFLALDPAYRLAFDQVGARQEFCGLIDTIVFGGERVS